MAPDSAPTMGPQGPRGIDAFTLKIIAISAMTVDHVGAVLSVRDQSAVVCVASGLKGVTKMETIPVTLNGEYVELCQLLKLAGIASSGGEGKHIVAAGEVRVDGRPESRKTAKIRAGQSVQCRGITIVVAAAANG